MKHSTLRIYLDWLDTVRELAGRHAGEAVEAWHTLVAMPDLADELRAVAGRFDELAAELRDIADGLEHIEHETQRAVGGIR